MFILYGTAASMLMTLRSVSSIVLTYRMQSHFPTSQCKHQPLYILFCLYFSSLTVLVKQDCSYSIPVCKTSKMYKQHLNFINFQHPVLFNFDLLFLSFLLQDLLMIVYLSGLCKAQISLGEKLATVIQYYGFQCAINYRINPPPVMFAFWDSSVVMLRKFNRVNRFFYRFPHKQARERIYFEVKTKLQ